MTLTDIIAHPTKLFHSLSMADHLNRTNPKVGHGQNTMKVSRLNVSMLNLFVKCRRTNHCPSKTSDEQRQHDNALLKPPLLFPTSDLSRSISNKSITFASVFDTSDCEPMPEQAPSVSTDPAFFTRAHVYSRIRHSISERPWTAGI